MRIVNRYIYVQNVCMYIDIIHYILHIMYARDTNIMSRSYFFKRFMASFTKIRPKT
jgi:hypothetical protein